MSLLSALNGKFAIFYLLFAIQNEFQASSWLLGLAGRGSFDA